MSKIRLTKRKVEAIKPSDKDIVVWDKALPGFGDAKARVFVKVLGTRLGAAPAGWEAHAADWPSIADVDSFEKIFELREVKRAAKAAKKAASP